MNGPTVESTTSFDVSTRSRSVDDVTSTSSTGSSTPSCTAAADILAPLRPTSVGVAPAASSSRSTRFPVNPVAPSSTMRRLAMSLPLHQFGVPLGLERRIQRGEIVGQRRLDHLAGGIGEDLLCVVGESGHDLVRDGLGAHLLPAHTGGHVSVDETGV